MMMGRRLLVLLFASLLVLPVLAQQTIEGRIREYGPAVRARLQPFFDQASIAYPPSKVALVAFKDQKKLQLYAPNAMHKATFIREYPILAASGEQGPKLREGDMQVPEGVYHLMSLNPNSQYHLSLGLNYPNKFDRDMAKADGRTSPGGAIMIHGKDVSAGCLAMGDEAAEDLFVLASDTGIGNVTVVISPVDFRTTTFTLPALSWSEKLYSGLRRVLRQYPLPQAAGTAAAATPPPPPAPVTPAPAPHQHHKRWVLLAFIIVLAALAIFVMVSNQANARLRQIRAARRKKMLS